MTNSTTPVAGLLILLLALAVPGIVALCCRPRKGRVQGRVQRWFFRNIWLAVPLFTALLLLPRCLLEGSNILGGYDNQLAVMTIVLPLGLSAVLTNLSHGKAGRAYAVSGMLLALAAALVALMLPTHINGRYLTYQCLDFGYIGTIPVALPLVLIAALSALVSGFIALLSRDRLPVAKVSFGKCLLRTLPLLVTLAAIGLSWAMFISEWRIVSRWLWFYQLWVCTVFLPMVVALPLLWTAHRRGSKGAAIWGIFCACVHAATSVLLYLIASLYSYKRFGDYANGLMIFSCAAAVAEVICAILSLALKRPALPVVQPAAEPAAEVPAAPEAPAAPAAMEAAEPVMASNIAPAPAETPAVQAPAAPAAPAPQQGIRPIVSYPYEPADLQPPVAQGNVPDLATRITKLTQLHAQGVLDDEAYEAAIQRVTAQSAAAPATATRPQRIYEDFLRNHVAYAYKSPAGVTFEPLREDMICIEPIKLFVGFKYHDLTVRMIKTHLDAPNSYGTMLRQDICVVIDDDFNPILVLSPSKGFGAVMNGVQTYTKLEGVKAE